MREYEKYHLPTVVRDLEKRSVVDPSDAKTIAAIIRSLRVHIEELTTVSPGQKGVAWVHGKGPDGSNHIVSRVSLPIGTELFPGPQPAFCCCKCGMPDLNTKRRDPSAGLPPGVVMADTYERREIRRRRGIAARTAVVLTVLCGFVYLWATGNTGWLPVAALLLGAMLPLIGFAGWVAYDLTFNEKTDESDNHP